MTLATLAVRPTGGCGAEIEGVHAPRATDAEIDLIRDTVAQKGVAFLHDQQMTPEEQIAFARRLAPIVVNRYFPKTERYPEIAKVEKRADQTTNIGGGWHTDHSYDQVPALGSILLARELPDAGGDTLFASMYAAWDALSEGLRQTLLGMRAVHSSRHVFGRRDRPEQQDGRLGNPDLATQDAVHPVAIRHPGSGRHALYVNPAFTLRFEGWTDEESRPLLEHLYRHAARPEFQVRFQWQPGSIAFWDNRATWHYAANDYQGERRLMHRITLEGEALA